MCNNDQVAGPGSATAHADNSLGNALAARFQQVCTMYPDRIAVTCDGEDVTYASLNTMADTIAGRLLKAGAGQGSYVAIWLERSVSMVAAMLGALKAGCAYLPLDPGYPATRITETLADAKPVVLITTQDLLGLLHDATVQVLLLDAASEEPGENVEQGDRRSTTRDDIAYLIYTSGSTGKPKGVQVTHGNVLRLFEQTQNIYQFSEEDVWTMFHSFAFDFSVWELYGALLYGGRVVIVPFEVSRTPEAFYGLLSREKVTVLNQTPSAFRLVLGVEDGGTLLPLALRYVIFGGEALAAPMLSNWFTRHGETTPKMYNMYGITETTVHVTWYQLSVADTKAVDTPMGVPLGDLEMYLLNEAGNSVAAGQIGEIYVSGGGVARGYHNRPALTAERFLPDPFRGDGTMMYRSGDLARIREDGAMIYAGRSDDQVKINGFRIELAEIEAAIATYGGVQQACVTTVGSGREKKLFGYFVAHPGTSVTIPALTAFLSERLPLQMLPSRLVALQEMPLTPNGKIDRKILTETAADTPETLPIAGASKLDLSELEASVLALVRETVGSQEIEIDGNFFEYGVESLQITRFAVMARERFGIKLTLRDVFEAETIAQIAARIDELVREKSAAASNQDANQVPVLDRR